MKNKNILFLCTGNSCRSQMAEGFARKLFPPDVTVYSAGTEPQDAIHPLAVQVMEEAGVPVDTQKPKSVRDFLGKIALEKVVFVCEKAEKNCPYLYPFSFQTQSAPFEDPASFEGSPEEVITKFRQVRDEIHEFVKTMAGEFE